LPEQVGGVIAIENDLRIGARRDTEGHAPGQVPLDQSGASNRRRSRMSIIRPNAIRIKRFREIEHDLRTRRDRLLVGIDIAKAQHVAQVRLAHTRTTGCAEIVCALAHRDVPPGPRPAPRGPGADVVLVAPRRPTAIAAGHQPPAPGEAARAQREGPEAPRRGPGRASPASAAPATSASPSLA